EIKTGRRGTYWGGAETGVRWIGVDGVGTGGEWGKALGCVARATGARGEGLHGPVLADEQRARGAAVGVDGDPHVVGGAVRGGQESKYRAARRGLVQRSGQVDDVA